MTTQSNFPQKTDDFSLIENAIGDALSGWRYLRSTHGDLYGVGWDRVENELTEALTALREIRGKALKEDRFLMIGEREDSEGNPLWCEQCGEAHQTRQLAEAGLCDDCFAVVVREEGGS